MNARRVCTAGPTAADCVEQMRRSVPDGVDHIVEVAFGANRSTYLMVEGTIAVA